MIGRLASIMTVRSSAGSTGTRWVLSTGLALGIGLSLIDNVDPYALFVLFGLACVGEWSEVRLGPLVAFSLRPVVAFVAFWNLGLSALFIVGLLPILLVHVLLGRRSLHASFVTAGKECIAFWAGYLLYELLRNHGLISQISDDGPYLGAEGVSFAIFWLALLVIRSVDLQVEEGIHFRRALVHLARHTWRHMVILTLASLSLSYVENAYGIVVTVLATVMLIEAYYPWKLLGEQDGVLLTSLQMMAQAVDLKDPYTSNHSQRVSRYATRLARTLGLPEEEVGRITTGALMHDIGKIGISGRIIRKPGRLTAEEQVLMREHSSVSADIIESLEILGESATMVRHHHENWDGTGYPDGLKGEEIPLASRIIFVADAFDALATDRPYRKGARREHAVSVIKENSGTQFDPLVVGALERVYHLF
jgi:putative nucleotidyltransferase with HDIG domain